MEGLISDICEALEVVWEVAGMDSDRSEYDRETLEEFVQAASAALDSFKTKQGKAFDING